MSDNRESGDGNKVVKFPKPDGEDSEVVLVCMECGCMSHFITGDFRVECTNCGGETTPENGQWRKHLPNVPAEVTEDTGGLISATVLGSRDVARKRVVKRMEQWEKEGLLAIAVAFSHEGEGSHWVDISTAEQKEWVVRKLRDVLEYMEKYDAGEGTCGDKGPEDG